TRFSTLSLHDALPISVEGVGAREKYSVRHDASGAAEDDPDEALARVGRCLDEALAAAGPLADAIGGVAVDTLVSNLLGLDAGGRSEEHTSELQSRENL